MARRRSLGAGWLSENLFDPSEERELCGLSLPFLFYNELTDEVSMYMETIGRGNADTSVRRE